MRGNENSRLPNSLNILMRNVVIDGHAALWALVNTTLYFSCVVCAPILKWAA